MRRQTIQKELVLNAVRSLRTHATAEDIYNYIAKDYPSVGKGTVYRNLNVLAEEGKVKKIEIPNGSDRFDFTLEKHYHVRCVNCDRVEDVKLDGMTGLLDQVSDSYGFQYLDYDILFRGVCSECQNAQ